MPDPISILEMDTTRHLLLCDELEALADRLCASFDLILAEDVIARIGRSLQRHVDFQERLLFPALRLRAGDDERLDRMLTHIEYEHAADQGVVVEMAEALSTAIRVPYFRQMDALGYLFRCYFEGARRHSAWERRALYTRANELLTDTDKTNLSFLMNVRSLSWD
jgi:hemerythrin-like domain-containing protein